MNYFNLKHFLFLLYGPAHRSAQAGSRPEGCLRRPASEPAQTGAQAGAQPEQAGPMAGPGREPGRACTHAIGQSKAATGVVTTRTAAVSAQHGDVVHGFGVRARTRAS